MSNKIILESSDGKSLIYSSNMMRASKYDHPEKFKEIKYYLENFHKTIELYKRIILNESIFPNIPLLILDILNKIENEEYFFSYKKSDLLKFMNDWKYEKNLKMKFQIILK